jgi:hypothetical protein
VTGKRTECQKEEMGLSLGCGEERMLTMAGSWLTLFEELVDALRRRRCGDNNREGTSDGG